MTSPNEPNLTETAGELTSAVGTLTAEVQRLSKRARRNVTLIRWTIAGLILDVTLTLIVGVLFNLVQTNSHHIREVQTKVGNQVLCPLYAIFLGAYDPKSPTAKANPQRYEAQFTVIRNSYKILECR
jgi:hypothetical protein